MKKESTYSLKGPNITSDNFYAELSNFADKVLVDAEVFAGRYIDDFTAYIQLNHIENLRPRMDYFPEFLMIGVYWKNYSGNASKTGKRTEKLLALLYRQRKRFPAYKARIDTIRGFMAFSLLEKDNRSVVKEFNLVQYKRLLNWLNATGEFNEEVLRLRNWEVFFLTRDEHYLEGLLETAVLLAGQFCEQGRKMLGKYVQNLHDFHQRALPGYKYREDYFFAARRENEYYLNMFAAEIMNRGLKKEFDKTSKNVLLLPTCMRKEPVSGCKAKSDGKELVCAACSDDCNIGKVASEMRKQGITSYLIPHSSDFSRFLVKWEDSTDTSLIGVACVLNLITGGYEMKRLGISSQCVFLDYCGCKKHWDKDGFATSINISQLKKMVHKPILMSQQRDLVLT